MFDTDLKTPQIFAPKQKLPKFNIIFNLFANLVPFLTFYSMVPGSATLLPEHAAQCVRAPRLWSIYFSKF